MSRQPRALVCACLVLILADDRGLTALDAAVELDNGDPRTVAEHWFLSEGLAGSAVVPP